MIQLESFKTMYVYVPNIIGIEYDSVGNRQDDIFDVTSGHL